VPLVHGEFVTGRQCQAETIPYASWFLKDKDSGELLWRPNMATALLVFIACGLSLSTSGLRAEAGSKAAERAVSDPTVLEQGPASWYEDGERTASGEKFKPDDMTAAHRKLPLGTQVKVVEPETGRSVEVRVNDRGPYVRGRVLDLSRGAARALGIDGVEPVVVRPLITARDSPPVD
jgi:rare lipoprotein A